MISYNTPEFNNIIKKITHTLENTGINIEDYEQYIPISAIEIITEYFHTMLEPVNKFVSTPCPKCSNTHLIPMKSTYKRNVIVRIENILLKIKITIDRLICENCGSTHAVLPDFCVPEKQYSKQAVLSIVEEASLTSTEAVADRLNADPKQIRRLVNIVKANKNNILLIYQVYKNEFNENIDSNSKLYVLIKSLPTNITELYFKQFKSIFLYLHNKRKIYIDYQKLSI